MSGALTVSDLTIWRAGSTDTTAIGPLSFDAAGASAIGIVGESGSGKTLTLRALMGLLPPNLLMRGALQLPGDLQPLRADEALRAELGRRVGVVLQDPFAAFDPLKTVGSQLVEGVVRRGLLTKPQAHDRTITLLTQMGFQPAGNILGLFRHQLSGGMLQRIAIAMAVMPEPEVLLADEPTSSLDANLRVAVLELMRTYIQAHNAVLVIVSHDLGLVASFCEQLIVMYCGQVVERGPARQLLERPKHPYTQALVACAPQLGTDGRRRLPSIPGNAASPFLHGQGCRFAPRCPFVMDRCRYDEPGLTKSADSSVACHLVELGSKSHA